MTGFDVFVILALLFSCAAGWFRGGLRELTSLFSLAFAALVALITLPWTAPFGRQLVDPDWAGSILAVGVVFLVTYFGLRLITHAISRGSRGHVLGTLDQLIGVGIGLIRAFVIIGGVHLTLMGIMADNPPSWFTEAKTLPVSITAARTIQIALPVISKGADALTPVVNQSVREGFSDQSGPKPNIEP